MYSVRCASCGDHDLFRNMVDVISKGNGAFACEHCSGAVQQIITPEGLPNARIDSAGDDATIPKRIADGTASWNLGLPGVDTNVGRRPDGTEALEYRPRTMREVSNNRNASEIAKRANLAPLERAYRPLGGN
jgi:hypothetical protein